MTAAGRIRQVLVARRSRDEPLLIEEYLPGPELSIDGLLDRGELTVTAVFAEAGDRGDVERALTAARDRLRVVID